MTVHFYDVGEGLAVLVDLPDGRHVLVDAGDNPRRRGCEECKGESSRLLRALRTDLRGQPIDLLWITHQHSDHLGGAPGVLSGLKVGTYVDNGRDAGKPEVRRAHEAASENGVALHVVDPRRPTMPLAASENVTLRAVLPTAWPAACDHDANECSIGLRIDFCASSVLFTGDAEHDEEAKLEPVTTVTLLQVAHHGSETSTTPGFLARARPRYAVISAGRPGVGLNRDYCHPRALIVQRLTRFLDGAMSVPLDAFDGQRCDQAAPSDWVRAPGSERLWATGRDGDVVLSTVGDGVFVRREP